MSMLQEIITRHPVRKTRAQKAAFRAFAVEEMTRLGYGAREEKKGLHTNVVAGDPDAAQVVFTAHYDTPAALPVPNFITPCNLPVFLLYQTALGLVMGLLAAAVGLLAARLTGWPEAFRFGLFAALAAMLYLMMCGPANRSNWNDNTSGVAAVMELMARIPEDKRRLCAFVLFDNEEKGMLGSGAFASAHRKVRKETLLINMDCVGDGENMLLFANKRTRALPEWEGLNAALTAAEGCTLVSCKMERSMYPSDQQRFKYGVALCACRKGKRVGYFCSRIHTRKDTICEQRNLDYLAEGLSAFVNALKGREEA